jgi:Chs5-Arf1p-binding protein BUD7/BCH1
MLHADNEVGMHSKNLQIGVYHHITGVDASSSASLAAYINTLTYKENHQSTTKIVEGVYW